MWSRTLRSFWLFLKAAISIFMKLRKLLLNNLQLFPSFPAYFWKTVIRTQCTTVSIGLEIFVLSELNWRLWHRKC